MNPYLYVDFQRCTACFACESACEIAHGSPSRIHLAFAQGLPTPLMCRQCENSPCAAVCPEQALAWKEGDGVVFFEDRCTRCGWCAVACPFGVLTVTPFGSEGLLKCDLCRSRREEGKRPACVLTCPTSAISDEPSKVLQRRRRRQPLATTLKTSKAHSGPSVRIAGFDGTVQSFQRNRT
ncbi:4Fe-4S dicluster domain-containing protein [Desulfosoma caldarium]|uniref:Formate dehydrogenase iron-sulfur subunit n=1 Tax=Desulfosoma caldarium TaxID=610254 RepID=A0A3N1UHH6_9BACT|nr:4Fe-4S dicluster domain-containing protein [Desulfosoma caldarium]ROQ90712.1 formate dehydrogenase iron-sulfur subunit [Desulfosoma caldarium]